MKSKRWNAEKRRRVCFVSYVVAVLGIAVWMSQYHFQLMLIQGASMEPSYHDLQLVIIEKDISDIQVGDVIAFYCNNLNSVLVKRVVALPLQTVTIRDGSLFVDGIRSRIYDDDVFEYAGDLEQEIILCAGTYAVIGDNIAESIDSRYPEVGMVSMETIIGRVCVNHVEINDALVD